jgi:hypothetical protein
MLHTNQPRTSCCTRTCLWSDQGWSQLHTQGLSKHWQLQPGLAQRRVAGSCSVCLCLQRQRKTQAPSATMKKKPLQAHLAELHLCVLCEGRWKSQALA